MHLEIRAAVAGTDPDVVFDMSSPTSRMPPNESNFRGQSQKGLGGINCRGDGQTRSQCEFSVCASPTLLPSFSLDKSNYAALG